MMPVRRERRAKTAEDLNHSDVTRRERDARGAQGHRDRPSGRARKCNPAHRKILVGCAHAATRTTDYQFHSHFLALKARKNHKQAVIATARKMFRVIHSVLKNRKRYVDPGTDCQAIMARRNAQRWIRVMKECGIEHPAAGQAATRPA